MNQKRILAIFLSTLLFSVFFIPIIKADNKGDYVSEQFFQKKLNDNSLVKIIFKLIDPEISWYPGFFIIQLLKVIIAIVLIILIIFNSLQP